MNMDLLKPLDAAKINFVLSLMYPTKAIGLDGMRALFYQNYWNIVGADVVNATLDFLNNGHFDPKINFTHIVLISKIPHAENISYF